MAENLEAVAQRADEAFEKTIAELSKYLEIPAISCEPEHREDVALLAEVVRTRLSELGFDALIRKLPEALPLVAAEWTCARKNAPTLLIYGHLDLQPVRGEIWSTEPHVATRKQTKDGERLFARGAADDMGGWVSHLAAICAWLEVEGDLPLNVKLILEGEEEIGSPNLEAYMDAYPSDFRSDVMVLTDCENPAVDLPGLTTSLRGLCELELTCSALTCDVHSGLFGNMAPDVSSSLVHLLARLTDDQGRPLFGRQEVPADFRRAARLIPLTAETIQTSARLRSDVQALPEMGRSPAEWLWRQPAMTILSTTLPRPEEHKNALRSSASATLSVRIPPGATKDQLMKEISELVGSNVVGGVDVELKERSGSAESWLYQPRGDAFEAANRAYEKAWGCSLVEIGIGGSIPFVALFGRRYSHLPLILNGVMDPKTGAHGPDESLHLGVFRKAILANVFLYDELSRLDFSSSEAGH